MVNLKSNLKFYKHEHTNALEYNLDCKNAGTTSDASCYISSAIDHWITEATHRHHPMLLKVHFTNPVGEKSTHTLPIFPAELERTQKSLNDYLDGKKVAVFTGENLSKNTNAYRNELLRYMKFLIVQEWLSLPKPRTPEQQKKFRFSFLGNFDLTTLEKILEASTNQTPDLTQNSYYKDLQADLDFREMMQDEKLIKKCEQFFENKKANNQWGNN